MKGAVHWGRNRPLLQAGLMGTKMRGREWVRSRPDPKVFLLVGGLVILVVALFTISDRRALLTQRFEVRAAFGNVTGIAMGAEVRLAGLGAGEVVGIEIPLNPGEPFVVRMAVREDLRRLVRTDAVAAVLADGVVGSAFIQIQPGSARSPAVENGGRIRGVDAVDTANLVSEGRDAFSAVAEEVRGLRRDMDGVLGDLNATIRSTRHLVEGTGKNMEGVTGAGVQVLDGASAVLEETRAIIARLSGGDGLVHQLLGDELHYEELVSTVEKGQAAVRSVRRIAEEMEYAVRGVGGREGGATRLVRDASEAAAVARDAMADLAENAEVLKRSWPFRGFFAERGFYNLDELTRDDYRQLLHGERYTPVRAWVDADSLFETDREGRIALAETAVVRLDQAMSEMLDYRRDGPLVVEGYAGSGESHPAFPLSQARADLVKSYLVGAYGLPAPLTGAIAMGSQAEDSPSGDGSWEGVALSMFVDASSTRRSGTRSDGPHGTSEPMEAPEAARR